jgi:hypothetical protein
MLIILEVAAVSHWIRGARWKWSVEIKNLSLGHLVEEHEYTVEDAVNCSSVIDSYVSIASSYIDPYSTVV